MKIQFEIRGNQENPEGGNPVPKIRKTGRQHWRPDVQRYAAFKTYVRTEFLKTVGLIDGDEEEWKHSFYDMEQSVGRGNHPIQGTPNASMKVDICWSNEHHGDAEGIFGSIADALFFNDKELTGCFEAVHLKDLISPERGPGAIVTIQF